MTLGPFLKTEDLYRIVEKDVLVNLKVFSILREALKDFI